MNGGLAGYLEDANIFNRGKDENERISSYLECIWNTIAVSFFLAHLLTSISCVIYIYLLGECVRCKVVFIRI